MYHKQHKTDILANLYKYDTLSKDTLKRVVLMTIVRGSLSRYASKIAKPPKKISPVFRNDNHNPSILGFFIQIAKEELRRIRPFTFRKCLILMRERSLRRKKLSPQPPNFWEQMKQMEALVPHKGPPPICNRAPTAQTQTPP